MKQRKHANRWTICHPGWSAWLLRISEPQSFLSSSPYVAWGYAEGDLSLDTDNTFSNAAHLFLSWAIWSKGIAFWFLFTEGKCPVSSKQMKFYFRTETLLRFLVLMNWFDKCVERRWATAEMRRNQGTIYHSKRAITLIQQVLQKTCHSRYYLLPYLHPPGSDGNASICGSRLKMLRWRPEFKVMLVLEVQVNIFVI